MDALTGNAFCRFYGHGSSPRATLADLSFESDDVSLHVTHITSIGSPVLSRSLSACQPATFPKRQTGDCPQSIARLILSLKCTLSGKKERQPWVKSLNYRGARASLQTP